MLLRRFLLAVLCCACISTSAFAADSPATLDPVIITASRSAETASESLAAVTVITQADIDRLQPRDLQDLLVGLPGVDVVSNGGPGKDTTIYLRGTESDHVLVLVDGLKIGSATSGSAAYQRLPVEQIERIEIVRGPRSSLYGSEAIGGVIQIFTHRGKPGQAATPSFAIGAGNLGSLRGEAGVVGGIGRSGWYGAGLSARTTDGIDVRPSVGQPDKDGFENLSGSLRAGWRFDSGVEWSVNALRAEGENEFDSSSGNRLDSVQQVLGTTLSYAPLAFWQSRLTTGLSADDTDNLRDGVFVSRFNTERQQLAWQNDIEIKPNHLLTMGLDHLRDEIDSSTPYPETSRNNTGGYAQYQGQFGRLETQLSGRHDVNEQFGERNTGGAALGWRFDGDLRLRAAYGTAFKAPTFNELYFPNFGNPDVEPETARNVELGISGRYGQNRRTAIWQLNVFRTEIDQLIVSNGANNPVANIDEARIDGAELQIDAQLDDWSLQTDLTWLDPENRSAGVNRGKVLQRRARRSGRLEVDRRLGNFGIGATLFGAGERYDNAANTRKLGGYATLALRSHWRFASDWQLQAEAANALDKTYQTIATYPAIGKTYFLTLRYAPSV